MIMKDKTLCKTCIHGEVSARSYFCNRCYDENGKFYPQRIAKRTETHCYDYIERGQSKMNDIEEIKNVIVYFADFVIDECRREEVPGVVELVGAYLKYLEKKGEQQ